MPTLSKCKKRQQSGDMHYPSGQRSSTKPHHHCYDDTLHSPSHENLESVHPRCCLSEYSRRILDGVIVRTNTNDDVIIPLEPCSVRAEKTEWQRPHTRWSSATELRFTKDGVSPTERSSQSSKRAQGAQSTSSHCCSFLCTVTWWVSFEVGGYFGDRLFKGEILSSDSFFLSTSCLPMLAAAANCCRISPEADVANSFVCRFLFVFWHSSTNQLPLLILTVFDFAWASSIFCIFVVRAALVRWHAKSSSPIFKKGRSVLKETINQSSKKRGVHYLLRFPLW